MHVGIHGARANRPDGLVEGTWLDTLRVRTDDVRRDDRAADRARRRARRLRAAAAEERNDPAVDAARPEMDVREEN